MTVVGYNNAFGRTGQTLDGTTGTQTVVELFADPAPFETLATGDLIKISLAPYSETFEIIHLLAFTATTPLAGQILRGQTTTTAKPHPIGTKWENAPTVVDILTAGGGVATGTITTNTPVTVPGGTNGTLTLTGTVTDPTSLFTVTATSGTITVHATGTYLISAFVEAATAVTASSFGVSFVTLPAANSTFPIFAGKHGFGVLTAQYELAATQSFFIGALNYDVAARNFTLNRLAITKLP